jgi:hypothetical protein
LNAIVVLDGLTHPHAEMYLETLEALDEVSGIVLAMPRQRMRSTSSGCAVAVQRRAIAQG